MKQYVTQMIFHKISSNVLFICSIFFVSVSLHGSRWKLDMLYTYLNEIHLNNSRFTYAYTWSSELIRLSYTRFTFCSNFFCFIFNSYVIRIIWKYTEYLSSVLSILFTRHIKKRKEKEISPWFKNITKCINSNLFTTFGY